MYTILKRSTQFKVFDIHKFSKNVNILYIHYIQYFNFVQSWNIIFKRLYTILYVQRTQFFKECYFQEMYPIMYFYPTQIFKERTQFSKQYTQYCTFNMYNFFYKGKDSVYSMYTFFQFCNIIIHKFSNCVHSMYTNFEACIQFHIFNIYHFKECTQL